MTRYEDGHRAERWQNGAAVQMLTEIDQYAVLGVVRTASQEEVRGAYRQAARSSHPDLHPNDASAAERFKRVQQAYEVLGDPVRRAAYDAATAPRPPEPVISAPAASEPPAPRYPARRVAAEEPISLARELGETVRAIRVVARRSGLSRRFSRLIRYLERL
jgi:curved DNA-binding protein CbpA